MVRLLERTAAEFEKVIGHESSPTELASAARRFIDARQGVGGEVTPLGAAAAWTVCTDQPEFDMRGPFLADIIARYGVAFAAEMTVVQAGLTIRYHPIAPDGPRVAVRSLAVRPPDDVLNFWIFEPHRRLRAQVAALDDAHYEGLIETVSAYRGSALARDILTSFLFPTQRHWVEADLAASAALNRNRYWVALPLLASIVSAEQAEAVFRWGGSREHAVWSIGQRMHLVYSMCANVGPGVEHLVAELFEGNLLATDKKRCARILAEFGTDTAFGLLLDRIDHKYVRAAVRDAMSSDPERAARLMGMRASSEPVIAMLLQDHLRAHPDLAGPARSPEPDPPGTDGRSAVPVGALPPLLADPPWIRRAARRQPRVLDLSVPERPIRTVWADGERDEWAQDGNDHRPWIGDRWADVVAGATTVSQIYAFAYAPEELVRPLLDRATARERVGYGKYSEHLLRRILGRFDGDAAEYLVRIVVNRPAQFAHLLLPIDGSEITGHMMRWFESNSLRPVAQHWFDRHVATASPDVVAAALGRDRTLRARAERVLRNLDVGGHCESVLRVARACHAEADAAVTEILDADPLEQLPRTLPKLPNWADPVLLPPVILAGDGRALPDSAVAHICTMLAMSRADDVYAGVGIVGQIVDRGSLARMAWALFERWSDAGFPDGHGWILAAQGIVGDDDTARDLAARVRVWPLQSAHRRAAAGLRALADIGTDIALAQLWSISQGLRFPALRSKADTHIRDIADSLGLSPLELADRVVPDLGLDADGTATFDYGARYFVLTLDEHLRPLVTDAEGRALKRIPRPGPADADGALDEYKRYTTLRKDLSVLVPELIDRFETAMVSGRRWTLGSLRRHLLGHPLQWQVCSRLVWSTVPVGDAAPVLFGLSSLRQPVDASGAVLALSDEETVCIPHPVRIRGAVEAWARALDRLGVVQPIDQIHRAVFDGDVESTLRALEGTKASTQQLFALQSRGWRREEPQDKGAQIAIEKHVDDHRLAVLMVYPGFNIADPRQWDEQKIVHVYVVPPDGGFDPVTASELLRDLDTIDTYPISGTEPDLDGAP